jgi:thioesterase domain-containing protein/acyl carrier protein
MYKTGDLGRYLLSGEVEFRGRGDQQIKLRGNRVEIPLVESVLRGHPQVDRCVVAARSTSDGELRLIAYVVAREGAKPSPQELRTYMQSRLASYMVPAAFIAIPEIPLNANCKVDLAALPDFEIALQERTEFTPPEGEMEAELARVWQRVLGVARVGRHDDFFDLGGHSLLANRLLTEIEKSFGHTLPVATLFEAPTVARLAEIMKNDGWTAPYSSLVRIKDEGSAPAFVCVHSLGANLVSYAGLAKRLGDNQPFYGLQPQGLDGKEQPHTRVEDMAERYIRELKKAQPDGPYYLGGVCLGGVVAFEMAQRLVAEGDEIGALVLIDTFCPGTPKHLPAHPDPFGLVQHVDWYAGEVLMRSWSERIPYLGTRAANVGRRAYALARTIVSKAIPSLAEQRGTTEAILQHVKSVNSQAWGQYKPKPYPGKITLLWCSETPTRCYRDRRLAWSDVAEHGLEVHIIPGNHMTMVEPPHVDVMAEILGRCLQRAHQEHEQSRTMAVDL